MDRELENETGISTLNQIFVKEPALYKVILHNDNYTSMDFVIEVLRKIFHKSSADAAKIMLEVHHNGTGLAGIYPYDIACTKIEQVNNMAKKSEYPLKCTCEAE